jgi:hypothetical protein
MKPGKGGSIYKDDMLVASTIRDGKLFHLKTVQGVHAHAAVTAESAEGWRRRLAHLGEENVKKLEEMARESRLTRTPQLEPAAPT